MNQDTIDAIAEAIWDATNEADGELHPKQLAAELAKRGYLIIRDPAHAPEAVEQAAADLYDKDFGDGAWPNEKHIRVDIDGMKWPTPVFRERIEKARAAITAYIERAR